MSVDLRQPRLRRSIDPRIAADGTIYFLRGPDQDDLVIEGELDKLRPLIGLLDGRSTVDRIASELISAGVDTSPAEVAGAIDELIGQGVADDAAAEVALLGEYAAERYERQLACFADAGVPGGGAVGQQRLGAARVCLLGLGGLGSWTAWALAAAGLGELRGVDCDRVELSNLNRQVLYGETDVGRLKTEAAGEALTRFSPRLVYEGLDVRLDGEQAVREAIAGAQFVVQTADWPPHRISQWVNGACFELGIPYLAVTQHPPQVRIGPTYVPGRTGCFACQEACYRREYPLYAVLEHAEQPVAPSATYGPACAVVGALAAGEVVAYLAGLHEPVTLGAALALDLRTYGVEREQVLPEPGCPVCG